MDPMWPPQTGSVSFTSNLQIFIQKSKGL
ncbi:hypothetical protein OIU77_026865 [Salix suchowensis]|uniref:Uncharacterized protein n=1 Tax=Salix suchowensis TaxID=1278906 RepID=A0ABQ9BRM0_9ROSI|nr:hypothetical protein OIU77_026865 [Salix suchowensis]